MAKTKSQPLTDWRELETLCFDGLCPNCEDETVTAIQYEDEDEIWFECSACEWDKTFRLSDAKEAGYHSFCWD